MFVVETDYVPFVFGECLVWILLRCPNVLLASGFYGSLYGAHLLISIMKS